MSGTGVLSGSFTIFIEQTALAPFSPMTIGAFGFPYEIIGVRVQQDAATGGGLTIQQTNGAGVFVTLAGSALPATIGTFFLDLNDTRGNRQIPTTVPLFITGPGLTTDVEYIAIECIGRQGITPPTPFTGVEALTIT